ncbi:MAG TPA: magnesium transporter [Thermoanaerobaculia bacterium]|jgi:magnesium transporter|nr:magnesium transporter [Thermoanaerobaculia bacterium]
MRLSDIAGPDVAEIIREDPAALGEGLSVFHPADIADLLQGLTREDRVRLLQHLDNETLGNTLTYADGETLKLALSRLTPQQLASALDVLEPDDAASVLSLIPEEKRSPILDAMTTGEAAAARGLLRFNPGTAGRLMTDKFVSIGPDWTVTRALDELRRIDPRVATVANLYVVDPDERLVGVVSLRTLLPARGEATIGSLMISEVVSVTPTEAQEEVARLVSKYSFSALPVVDDSGRILGIVTVDDVLDVLVSRETESMLRMGGVAAEDASNRPLDYFGSPIMKIVRARIGWLLLLFLAGTLTGSVLRHFEGQLSKVVALSIFIPLIIGTGGNAGSQSVSTIIRALALGQVRMRDAGRVLLRESLAGLLLGTALCVFAVIRTMLWGNTPQLALVVGLTILCVCAWANIVGALVPLLAQRLNIDPTVSSAPLITTLVDATGLAIYMLIARAILDV